MTRMQLGVILFLDEEPSRTIQKIDELGFGQCQIACWNPKLYNAEIATKLKKAAMTRDIEITSIWAGLPGTYIWNLQKGPSTIGLAPLRTRKTRIKALKKASDFTNKVNAQSITTHLGFTPVDPESRTYHSFVRAVREISDYCQENEQEFWFETGEDTPTTLLRLIDDLETDNIGVNYDPANFLIFGTANPIDAFDILHNHIRGFHAKDAIYPKDGRKGGEERPLGEGLVNFSLLISKLKAIDYKGPIIIEKMGNIRTDLMQEIRDARRFLEKLC